MIKAIQNKRQGAKTFFGGWLFFFVIIVHDILYHQLILQTVPLFHFGLFGFIFSQAAVLSMRFSGAFSISEKLSEELQHKTDRLEETSTELSELTKNLELRVEERTKELDEAKSEVEELNQFIHLVNSLASLDEIFSEISKYIYQKYTISACWLFLPDEKREFLYAYKIYSYHKLSDKAYQYSKNKKVAMKENEGGMLYKVFQRKKPFYLERIPKFEYEIDKEIVEALSIRSFLYVPLLRREECVGIFGFSNADKEMKLSKKEIHKISSFCSQVAGAIDAKHLLEQVERAKRESEKQKRETEELNILIKSLNEEFDLKVIMQKVHAYVKENFNIQYHALYKVNSNKTHIELIDVTFPDFVVETDREIIRNFQIPIQNVKGAHAFPIKARKPLFTPYIPKGGKTEEEIFVIEKCKTKSFLMIPLFLQNEPIGILDFSNHFEKMVLTREDITRLSILGEQLAGIIHGSNLFKQVQEEKEKALAAQAETEKARQEIEKLNEFTKKINSLLVIETILEEIFQFTVTNFKIDFGFIQLKEGNSLKTKKIGNYSNALNTEELEFVSNLIIPLNESGGIPYKAYVRKKPVFMPLSMYDKIFSREYPGIESDKMLMQKIRLRAYLIIPLIMQNEVIGLTYFTSHNSDFDLSKSEIKSIEGFCNQIVGVIHNANLLKQTEEARKQADIEKGIAEVALQEAETERQKSEKLLLNILPKDVANELKEKGFSEPVLFEEVSVMFTDFKGFTQIAEKLSPQELVKDLDACFVQFDKISERYNLEKLKTIGDSYMCAGGIPRRNTTHAIDCVMAALEIQDFMNLMKSLKEEKGFPYWELRLGIHSGPLVAGVIGEKKFAYDVWGDTVNTASRMESSGTPGKINISGSTYELVKDFFDCEFRGMVQAKNKGEVAMYYINGLKPEYSKDENGRIPNGRFWKKYTGSRFSLNVLLIDKLKTLWKESDLSLNIPVIDLQHLWLYYLILELEKINSDRNSLVRVSDIKQILSDLLEYVSEHFRIEEYLLAACNYSQTDSHVQFHTDFSKFVDDKFNNLGKIQFDETEEVVVYLKDWLSKHISIEDRKYRSHIDTINYDIESFFTNLPKEEKPITSIFQKQLYESIAAT